MWVSSAVILSLCHSYVCMHVRRGLLITHIWTDLYAIRKYCVLSLILRWDKNFSVFSLGRDEYVLYLGKKDRNSDFLRPKKPTIVETTINQQIPTFHFISQPDGVKYSAWNFRCWVLSSRFILPIEWKQKCCCSMQRALRCIINMIQLSWALALQQECSTFQVECAI